MRSMNGIACGAVCLALCAGPAAAQGYPAKPVRVMIPWQAGGSNDIVGRIVFQKVGEALGQQFVIDNRAGASGTIGSELVARSAPDGYTLMVHSATHVGNAHLYPRLPYDTLKDFAPLALLASQPGMLVVHPSLPVKSVPDFLALARARPGEIFYPSSGNGSAPHLSMALLGQMAGLRLVHVPYKSGPQGVVELVSGQTQVMLPTLGTVMPHLQANRLRGIAVSSSARFPAYPAIPTLSEGGVTGYEMTPWIGAFAPAGTPRAVLERVSAECARALQIPDIAANMAGQGMEAWYMNPDEFGRRVRADYGKYAKLIQLTGAKLD